MTKILHILQTLGVGGMENRVARLASGMAKRGFHVTIMTLRPATGRRPALADQVDVVLFDIGPGIRPVRLLSLSRFIKSGKFDIVHTHNWSTMLYGILAAKIAACPIVIHGEHGLNFHDLKGIPWKRAMAQRWLASLCNHIVAVHAEMSDTLRREWRLDSARITPIPNGVDLARFTHRESRNGSGFIIGAVGRLDLVKDLECLLKAFAALKAEYPADQGLNLLLLGDGPEKKRLESAAAALGLGASVTFQGDIADPEQWYPRFSVFVNTSVFEGMSNTILEAMACGLPMVVSSVRGNSSWIKEENALFFIPGDDADLAAKLMFVRSDSGLTTTMGATNRRRVETEFDNRFFLDRYEKLYRSLLQIRRS